MPRPRILFNMVHHPPLGHAVESLRWAYRHHAADPAPRKSILLSRQTSFRLTALCPWIDGAYTVDLPHRRAAVSGELLEHVPREGWDHVVAHPWSSVDDDLHSPGAFFRYFRLADEWFRPRRGRCLAGDDSLPYARTAVLRLELPQSARAAATRRLLDTRVRIAVVPAGSGKPEWYPSARSWRAIVDALAERHDDLSLYVIGKTGAGASAWTRAELDSLIRHRPATVDCVDLDLFEQLAIVQACDLAIGPHTGFGFAVTAVGTPRLTISGGRWWDRFLNGVACHSVLPDPERYPCFDDDHMTPEPDSDDGPRIASMSFARIREDLEEIAAASEALAAGRWTAEEAAERHWSRLADWARRSPARTDIPLDRDDPRWAVVDTYL